MSCSASTSPDGKVISWQVATRGRTAASSTSLPAPTSTSLPAASSASLPAAGQGGSTSSRATAAATGCTALQQVTRPLTDAAPPGKVTKTIVTTGKAPAKAPAQAPAKPVPASHGTSTTSTRVITTRAAGRDAAGAVALTEMPLSGVTVKPAASSSSNWRSAPLRSRSISPKRNYTPRRGRASTVSADATISSLNLSTDGLSREYRTYCSRGESRVSTYTSTAPAPTATAGGALKGGEASITLGAQVLKRSAVRSSSPAEARAKSVECRAVFMHQGRSWKFNLPPESSVNEAISAATQQVLRNVVETDHRLGDRLSISVLPAITDTSTVGEWAHRNLDQPPLIIIQSEMDGLAQQQPELDAQNVQRLMEEQTRLLVALQKQLGEQTAIIRNQASFISELQARDRQQAQLLGETVGRIEEDMASMKGQLLTLEEHLTRAGNENNGKKSKG